MTARLTVAVALAWLTICSARWSWSADNVAAAAAHYKQGRKLYQVGEYARALEEFKQAYLAKEDAAFLFNIAQCHRQLGATREAITFYRRYIKEAPADVANRAEAEKLVRDLEAAQTQQPAADTPPPPEASPAPAYPPPMPPPAGQPPPPVVAAAAAPVAPRAGFHLEIGLGAGGMRDDFKWGGGVVTGDATGGSGAFQLVFAWGISPRWVLGGLAASEWVQSPHVRVGGQVTNTVSVGALGFLGLLADFRLAQDRATGWHFQAAVGGARMSLTDDTGTVSGNSPAGGGLVMGAGYDWQLSANWQWGLLGRLMALSLSDEGVDHSVGALSILLAASYR